MAWGFGDIQGDITKMIKIQGKAFKIMQFSSCLYLLLEKQNKSRTSETYTDLEDNRRPGMGDFVDSNIILFSY